MMLKKICGSGSMRATLKKRVWVQLHHQRKNGTCILRSVRGLSSPLVHPVARMQCGTEVTPLSHQQLGDERERTAKIPALSARKLPTMKQCKQVATCLCVS